MEQAAAKLVVFTGAFFGVAEDRKPQERRVAVRADLVTMVERGRYRPEKLKAEQGTNVRYIKLTAEEQADAGREGTILYLATGQTIPVLEAFDEVVRAVEEGKQAPRLSELPFADKSLYIGTKVGRRYKWWQQILRTVPTGRNTSGA